MDKLDYVWIMCMFLVLFGESRDIFGTIIIILELLFIFIYFTYVVIIKHSDNRSKAKVSK